MLCSQYFIINFKWQVVICSTGGQKSNLSCKFKLELITTYHL